MASGSLRPIYTMAVIALLATMLLYLVSLQQVTDTGALKAARVVKTTLARNLEPDTRVTVVVAQRQTPDDRRHFVLRLTPAARIATDDSAVDLLARRAAEIALGELRDGRSTPVLTCVSLLGGGQRRITFAADLSIVDEPPPPPAPVAPTAAR